MPSLSIENVVRVSVLQPLRGLEALNTSSLALITDEVPIPNDFGTSRVYLSPEGVAQDFGSNSETYRLALVVFGQNPNVLTGRGFLVIIPREQSASDQPAVILSSNFVDLTKLTATDYEINVAVDGAAAADLTIGEVDTTDLASAEADLNSTEVAGAGLEFELSGEVTSCTVKLKTSATGASKSIEIGTSVSTGTDIATLLNLSGQATGSDAGVERVKDCVLRTLNSVSYFGIILNTKETDANLTELAALIQSLDKLLFAGSNLTADISGIFTDILDAGYTKTRCLLHTSSENDALDFAAAYASRGLSINFSGVLTALTMNLKDLVLSAGADTGITQTYYDQCKAAGIDLYVSYRGLPKVVSFGANSFFDAVYISLALKINLQVVIFNYLAQTNTKIPQTEEGMAGLKKAVRDELSRFVTNGCFAPGSWTSSTVFGDPETHIRNIQEVGYFVYSLPIAQQSSSERSNRIAPVVQIAAKSSGALHTADAVVFIEP
ncbi:DUF3383 family protein [Candidatus Pacearchaeota archaeon]|nr:DUF3383 family protein [Candidatus Pacearchaeota archaeon]